VKLLERNILDPDVIVLGGGLSNILKLYAALPILDKRAAAKQSEKWVQSHTFFRRSQHPHRKTLA